jgi:hypothetical protein
MAANHSNKSLGSRSNLSKQELSALIVLLVPTTIPEDTAARQCILNVQN